MRSISSKTACMKSKRRPEPSGVIVHPGAPGRERMPKQMQTAEGQVLAWFEAGEFEKAIHLINSSGVGLDIWDIGLVIASFESLAAEARQRDDFVTIRQLRHRKESLLSYYNGGFDAGKLILPVRMPEGYCGKILLVSISGGVIGETVCLRSNDLHHRDILRNTELEIQDLCLHGLRVGELGGAHIHTGPGGSMCIWGGSDDFGACDKEFAAMLIEKMYPGKIINIQD